MRKSVLFGAATLLLVSAGCGEDPAGVQDRSGEFYLSAKIGGADWTASPATIQTTGSNALPGWIALQGGSTGGNVRSMALQLGFITGVGTYPLGVNQGTTAGGAGVLVEGARSWMSPFSGSSGTVTITELTATRMTGTFSFDGDAVGSTDAPLNVQIREGRFSVPLPPQFAIPSTDGRGSRVAATVGGQPWNAATIAGSGGGESLVAIVASTDDYSLTIALGPPEESGPQPLSEGFPVRRVSVQGLGAREGFWGRSGADEGTITVTSLTATRIVGTFSGTLRPTIAGSELPDLVLTNGEFDVRIAPR